MMKMRKKEKRINESDLTEAIGTVIKTVKLSLDALTVPVNIARCYLVEVTKTLRISTCEKVSLNAVLTDNIANVS
jgi:hypothetical protein